MSEFKVSYSYTVTEFDSQIIEAETAEEAEELLYDEIWVDDVEIYTVEEV